MPWLLMQWLSREPGMSAELEEKVSSLTEDLVQVRAQNIQHREENSRLSEELQSSAVLIHELRE